MGKLLELVNRARQTAKLRKGQCMHCQAILPDDAKSRYCNQECRALSDADLGW
jgi:hypothetical protein